MKRFTGKTAIVTGAGQGIGFEIGKMLCNEGATVILNDIDPQLNELAVEELQKYGVCYAFPGDVSTQAFNQDIVDFAVAKTGSLDVAFANAGITLFGSFLEFPEENFLKVLQVNLGGSFFLAQAAGKQFIKQGKGGSIVFTSSVTGHQAHKDLAAYGMTKAGIEMLAKNLVLELSPYKINVNAIAPGATLTNRTMEDQEYKDIWAKITPIGSAAYPSDIAKAALFLASDDARHITGQTLIVDGGWTAVSPAPF